MNQKSEETHQSEHDCLASIIKGVHRHLRREFRANTEDVHKVWQQHAENEDCLNTYATAMYRLATEHWSKYAETRIDWCRMAGLEYFKDGGFLLALQKDFKRTQINVKRYEKSGNKQTGSDMQEASPLTFEDFKTDTVKSTFELSQVLKGKIRLLDVGSCYNPFLGFEHFETVGIDLYPAQHSVFKCDFLQLTTTELPSSIDPLSYDLNGLSSPITELPMSSFHVVVFSLLLEYLPSPGQRWHCCSTASDLLCLQGLLLIITPDSHSQHRNAPMMKSWKLALEKLGFLRWKYEKKDHVHCMAFRKVSDRPAWEDVPATERNHLTRMLYIPQDFNDACYDDVPRAKPAVAQTDPSQFLALASELPFLD